MIFFDLLISRAKNDFQLCDHINKDICKYPDIRGKLRQGIIKYGTLQKYEEHQFTKNLALLALVKMVKKLNCRYKNFNRTY